MGNPEEGKPAPAAPSATSGGDPSGRAKCQYGEQCNRKNPDHKKEFSHPGDPDWDATGAGYQAAAAPAAPYPPPGEGEGETAEDRGFLGAAAGAAAGFGGMKLTGADDKMGFFGKAAVMAGAAVAGSLLQDHVSGGTKGKKKKGKKGKKGKKTKSRELDVGERGLPDDESSSGSGESGEESEEEQVAESAPKQGVGQAATGRTKCEYGEQCFRKNPEHRQEFSHPGDPDYS